MPKNPQKPKSKAKRKSICEGLDLKRTNKKQLIFTIRFLEDVLQSQGYTILGLRDTISFQQKIINENKAGISTIIDKYEDQLEELQKQNTQLTLSFEELKVRHFGKFERRLKEFALRPDKKKDN
jgi:hypothetical protein